MEGLEAVVSRKFPGLQCSFSTAQRNHSGVSPQWVSQGLARVDLCPHPTRCPRKESLTTHPSQGLNKCDGVRKCSVMCNRITLWVHTTWSVMEQGAAVVVS